MADRQRAGRMARRHGADAEREWTAYQQRLGRTALRVRNQPYDVVSFDRKKWRLQQVKSYLLSREEMETAKKELTLIKAPRGTIKEVGQRNRHRGRRKRRGVKVWSVEEVL